MGEKEQDVKVGTVYIDGQPVGTKITFTIADVLDAEPMEEAPQVVRPLAGEGAEFVMKTAPVTPPKMIENFFMSYIRDFSYSLRALVEIKIEHPKWIHLYRQAKKYRARKKYARKINREIMTKVNAYAEREAEQCQPQS